METYQQEYESDMSLPCRLCANNSAKIMGIFSSEGISNDLPNKMSQHLHIQVSENDSLPLQCCLVCVSTLVSWHEFFLSCAEADIKLQDQYSVEMKVFEEAEYKEEDIETEHVKLENYMDVQTNEGTSQEDFRMSEHSMVPETDDESKPPEKIEKANEVIDNVTPQKSRPKYEAAYKKFMEWRSEKEITSFSESIFLTYFNELSENRKPTTLWATYSMLRPIIEIKHKFDICKYSGLLDFLKQKNKGYKSKKAQVLSTEQINQFLREAPDNKFLAVKVALIFGVQGACKRHELRDLTVDDIKDKGDMILVKIPKTKNDKSRSFVVTDEFYHIYKKYAISRPTNMTTTRFFAGYRDGKCIKQVIGINSFGSMPKTVARYLKLKEPESYTGHTFRRTSASLLADSGADLLTLNPLRP